MGQAPALWLVPGTSARQRKRRRKSYLRRRRGVPLRCGLRRCGPGERLPAVPALFRGALETGERAVQPRRFPARVRQQEVRALPQVSGIVCRREDRTGPKREVQGRAAAPVDAEGSEAEKGGALPAHAERVPGRGVAHPGSEPFDARRRGREKKEEHRGEPPVAEEKKVGIRSEQNRVARKRVGGRRGVDRRRLVRRQTVGMARHDAGSMGAK
mmetsp:Transcript_13887/g.34293  ORF Transcript_13887/g.34293 Transcript_13887/m.34293 type:complete len:213 (+) Transcript_13887:630-1268(+)